MPEDNGQGVQSLCCGNYDQRIFDPMKIGIEFKHISKKQSLSNIKNSNTAYLIFHGKEKYLVYMCFVYTYITMKWKEIKIQNSGNEKQ
jgi:hypothetical protein